jgi:hypothetical protein
MGRKREPKKQLQRELTMARSRKSRLSAQSKVVDLLVYNDSTMLSLFTEPPDKKAPPVSSGKDGVQRELAFVLPLCQDDSYSMRVRLGSPSASEKREFIGSAAGHLDLSSGVLLSGESGIDVPPQRYRVEVRSFLPHSMGWWQWERAAGKKEKIGAYWRRTRPGTAFPDWLRWNCLNAPMDDPGHEKEWRSLKTIEPIKTAYVDFLVCLLRPSGSKPISPSNRNGIAEWEIRCPAICPQGIQAPGLPVEDWIEDFN